MTKTTPKTYLVGVIERAIAYYEVQAEDARTAAENWQDGEFHDRDDEALDSEGPSNVRERQPDGSWRKLPLSEWEAEPPAAGIPSEPATSKLLALLEALLPYAESEAYSLGKLKDSPEAEAEAERAWQSIERAHASIAEAKAAGITPAPADIDIHALLAERRQISAGWSIEDVQEVRPDLTDEKAWAVLQQAERRHDATIGINWDVLECHAEMLFGPAPDSDEPEGE